MAEAAVVAEPVAAQEGSVAAVVRSVAAVLGSVAGVEEWLPVAQAVADSGVVAGGATALLPAGR